LFGLARKTIFVRSVTRSRIASTSARQIGLRRDDRRRAIGEDLDLVDEEAVLGENRLVAGPR
jgi:hypothetical protein